MGGQGLIGTVNQVQQPNYNGSGQTTPTQNPYGTNPYSNSTNPYIQAAQQTQYGNLQGAQAATAANRVNQTTPFGNLNYQQTGVDANGNPIWAANQTLSPELQGSATNLTSQLQNTTSQGFNPNLPSYGINPGQTYSDAIMQRLQPTLQHQSEMSDAQLANQGIMPGSEAYNNAKRVLNQSQNDQLTSAIVGGMQTGLSANNQAYNQALQNYNLPLSQLSALKSVATPNYVNPYSQAAVAGPDYSGAYTTQANANLAAQNAAAAQQAGLTSGLFSLGGSAIQGSGGLGGLASTIGSGLSTIGGWLGL